ncbi:MAG: hypothetical protein Q7S94_01830 [Gallionella sp.]|nr:hypothetical protein [Gallionella sp.]
MLHAQSAVILSGAGALLLAVDALKQRKDLLVKHIRKGVERLPEEVRKSLCDGVEIPDIEWDAKTGAARISM